MLRRAEYMFDGVLEHRVDIMPTNTTSLIRTGMLAILI